MLQAPMSLAQPHNLRISQERKTVTEYVRHMQSCFEGITVLPLSMADKIERFIQGLNDDLRIRILPAPVGAGVQA